MITHVLDTCALLDLATERWTDRVAREALQRAAYPVVLSISVWEIARKVRLNKLSLPCGPGELLEFVQALCQRHDIYLVPVTPEICCEAEMLPPHHEDPFDRMIIGAARLARAPIFTIDSRFSAYGVKILPQR